MCMREGQCPKYKRWIGFLNNDAHWTINEEYNHPEFVHHCFLSHCQLSKSVKSWSEVVEWNIQLLRQIIANLFWTRCARVVYVPSVAERVVTFGLIAAGAFTMCLTMRKETGEVLPGRGERLRHKIRQSGEGDEAPTGEYLKILWNGLWNFMVRIGSWLQGGKQRNSCSSMRKGTKCEMM